MCKEMISWGHDRDNKRTSADEHCDFNPDTPDWASRLQPVEYRRTSRSPGFSRWNTCRGRSSFRASRLQPVEYRRTSRSPGVSRSHAYRGRTRFRTSRRQPVGYRRTSGSPGFSRWNTCRDGAYCPASLVRLTPGLQSDGGRASRLRPLCSGVPASAGGIPAGGAAVSGRPGVSRWDTCRGRTSFRESRR
jgi:hypothetical protein